MTSSSSMSFSPSRKSSSMFSICVPAFLRWELHQAVNVCRRRRRGGERNHQSVHLHTRNLQRKQWSLCLRQPYLMVSLRIFAHRVIKSTLLYNLLTVARVQCIKPCKDNLSKGRIIFGSVNIRATGWRIREGGFCPTEKQPNGNPKKSAVRGKSKVEGSLISKLALASSQEDCFCTVTVNCTWAAQNFLANWMRWIRF